MIARPLMEYLPHPVTMSTRFTSGSPILKSAVAGASVAPGWSASSHARIRGSNDRVRVGVIGYSDRGRQWLYPSFLTCARDLNFEFVAVSDLWNRRREEGAAELTSRSGRRVRAFRNNEELFDARVVDAVIISTADFQHALHTIDAVQAGCDVYAEKPFANTMSDANRALDVVSASDRIVQVGTQRRSDSQYIRADAFIRSGAFGDIVMAEMTWNVNQPDRWRRPGLVQELKESDVDWKRYLMNRPFEPWDPRKYLEYRLFWPYSSGIPDQWMVHQIDTVHWFTDLSWPRSVVANGGIYLWDDGRRNPDTMTAVFDYGPFDEPTRGFQVVYSSRMTNGAGGTKEIYYSNGGTLDLDRSIVSSNGGLSDRDASVMGLEARRLGVASLKDAVPMELPDENSTLSHMRNWMACVRDRKTPSADIHAAYNHSVALCMTIAALHTGKRVTFDALRREVETG
jgi:predicted dehydrogenase